MNTTQITAAISSIRNNGIEFDKEVQRVLVATASQVKEHGNITYIVNLYKALPNGANKKAARDWMLDFGGVLLNDNKDTKKEMPFIYNKLKNNCDPLLGDLKQWYDYKKESVAAPKPFVIEDKLVAFVKSARKAELVTCMSDIDQLVSQFKSELEDLLVDSTDDDDNDDDDYHHDDKESWFFSDLD